MNKKVILIVTQLEAGGAQRAAFNLAEGLREKGYDVKVVFFYKKKDAFKNKEFEILFDRPLGITNLFSLFHRIFLLLKKERPNVVISFTYYANVITHSITYLLGLPVRIASQRNPSSSYPRLIKFLDLIFGSLGIYTHNVMVSKSVQKSFEHYPGTYKHKMLVVYNGVSQPEEVRNSRLLRESLGLAEDKLILVNVGRLSLQKNQALLIKCVRKIERVYLVLIGEGELRKDLEAMAKGFEDKVKLCGQQTADNVKKYLMASDIFVLPSLYEGMSNALLEALAVGLPIISSDIPEQAEVLVDNETNFGCLLPPHDEAKWISEIEGFRDSREQVLRYSSLSRRRSSSFSIDSMVSGFEKLWQ